MVAITKELIEYVSNSAVTKAILQKPTGSVSIIAVEGVDGLLQTTSAFDMFIQIIDGKAEIIISGKSNFLIEGQSIVIAAHTPNRIVAVGRFKMIQSVTKSGYEL